VDAVSGLRVASLGEVHAASFPGTRHRRNRGDRARCRPNSKYEIRTLTFAEALAELSSTLTGEAVLSSLDGYLDFTFTATGSPEGSTR